MPHDIKVNNQDGVLTPTEAKIAPYVADGKTNWELGQIFGSSERTAKDHVLNMMHKMDACTRAHLVTQLFRHRILEFMCLLIVIQGGIMAPPAERISQTGNDPFRTTPRRSTTRTRLNQRPTRSVQIRVNRRGFA